LLIVDEAKDFVPAIKSPPSKASLQLLAAQARKYHLGLVLATQNPKEIENKVIGNCATHFYGKASSPNSRQVIQDQLQARGGRGDDVAQLKAGQFYAYNSEAGMRQPVKLTIPMCLSQHKTLDESEILALAAESRGKLAQAN
jgi:DNA helicase HerA-like ATPase